MPWFAVRTFIRIRRIGRATNKDRQYKTNVDLVEDRIVLFKTRNWTAALRKAQLETRTYCREFGRTKNVYGQRLRAEVLGDPEVYEPFDPLGDSKEIYSSMEWVDRKDTAAKIISRKTGRPSGPMARMFMAAWISEGLDKARAHRLRRTTSGASRS